MSGSGRWDLVWMCRMQSVWHSLRLNAGLCLFVLADWGVRLHIFSPLFLQERTTAHSGIFQNFQTIVERDFLLQKTNSLHKYVPHCVPIEYINKSEWNPWRLFTFTSKLYNQFLPLTLVNLSAWFQILHVCAQDVLSGCVIGLHLPWHWTR